MSKNWNDFKVLYGNSAGAREGFEDACETLFRKVYPHNHVSQVAVKIGDGGIDIFIGELGVEPIIVIQCKFFLDSFGASQQSQIRESFLTAVNSKKYELKEWILCVPRVIDIDENSWWFKWKHKMINKYAKSKTFIKLKNGNELIDLMKENNVYNQIFKVEEALKIDEIHSAIVSKKVEIPKSYKPKTILFNNYSSINEPFYLERFQDKEFNRNIDVTNIWLFGKSGTGKTALINRNLIQNNIEYCFCDLSPITITSVDDVLAEVICSIEDNFDIERSENEKNKIKEITQLLCRSSSSKTVIVIDELSVDDDELISEIASSFIKLVTYFNNYSNQEELQFVISTIANPKIIINNKSKASDYFQYICSDSWSESIEQLFNLLNESLNLNIIESKDSILGNSNDSPRILKNIFRKIVISDNTNQISIDKAIKKTIEEIV